MRERDTEGYFRPGDRPHQLVAEELVERAHSHGRNLLGPGALLTDLT